MKRGQVLTIGPLENDPGAVTDNVPRLTDTITNNRQQPPSAVRAQPRLLYVVTDLASSLRRDLWLKNTAFENSHIIIENFSP